MSGVAQACAQIGLLYLDWFYSPDLVFCALLFLIEVVLHLPPTQPQWDTFYSIKDCFEPILLFALFPVSSIT